MGNSFHVIRGWAAAAFCFLTISVVVPAQAADETVSAADAAAIHKVVEGQLSAFQRDDGNAAFSYAAPKIRDMFQSPDIFMTMVRNGYAPVYRPKHVTFEDVDIQEGMPTQHVLLVGPDGVEVEALYFMEHEADGRWLINGCVLRPSYQA